MTALPLFHINAPAYSVLGSLVGRCRARAAAALLRERLPRLRPPPRGHRVQRDRGDARDPRCASPSATTTPTPRCASPTPDPRRTATSTSRSRPLRPRAHLRLRACPRLRTAPSGGTAPGPYGTLGSLRQHPTPRHGQRGPRRRRRRRRGRRRRHGRAAAAQPGRDARLLGHAGGDRGRVRRRLAAHRRPRHGQRRRDVHLRRAQEAGHPPPRPEPLARRGRGGDRRPPLVLECAVVAVPSELTEDEVKAFVVTVDGSAPDFHELRAWAADRLTAFKVPRFWQAVDALPRTPTQRVADAPPSHRAPARGVRRRRRRREPRGDAP